MSLNSTQGNASGDPLRRKGADSNDTFTTSGNPRIAFSNGHIYVAYADLPLPGSTADRGDVFLAEGIINADHSLTFNGKRTVNNDRTTTDQWNPSITAAGNKLFIGYYSRQNDPLNNSLVAAYGAKVNIGQWLSNATFECFQISTNTFPPLFAGSSTPPGSFSLYDPVWPPGGVCLDVNATPVGTGLDSCNCTPWPNSYCVYPDVRLGCATFDGYVHSCADDYTWAAADSTYFYFAWCDRTRTYGPSGRPDADVKLSKIKQ